MATKKRFADNMAFIIPVTLVFWNDILIGRHYGERTPDELETIFNRFVAKQCKNLNDGHYRL